MFPSSSQKIVGRQPLLTGHRPKVPGWTRSSRAPPALCAALAYCFGQKVRQGGSTKLASVELFQSSRRVQPRASKVARRVLAERGNSIWRSMHRHGCIIRTLVLRLEQSPANKAYSAACPCQFSRLPWRSHAALVTMDESKCVVGNQKFPSRPKEPTAGTREGSISGVIELAGT